MGKVNNTYIYIIIILILLLLYGGYKIFNTVINLNDKLDSIVLTKTSSDPGPSGITNEEKIQNHLESLESIEEDNLEE